MQHFIFIYYLLVFLAGGSAITLLIVLQIKYGERWIIHYIFLLITLLVNVLLSGIQFYFFGIVNLPIPSSVFLFLNIGYFLIFGALIYLLPILAHFLTQTPITPRKRVFFGVLGSLPVPFIAFCLSAVAGNEAKSRFVNFWNYGPYTFILGSIFIYAIIFTAIKIRKITNPELKKVFRTIVILSISYLPALFIDTQWMLFQVEWKIIPRAFTFYPLLLFIVSILTIIYSAKHFILLSTFEREVKDHIAEIEVTDRFAEQYKISQRESEIIRYIIQGDTNKEISNKLCLALGTVKNHVYSVYKKTGLDSRIELLNLLRKNG
jgi:DNA-binding CsgD family transcriptional regulator